MVASKGCVVITVPENGVAARKTTIAAAIGPMPGTNANIVFHLLFKMGFCCALNTI